MANSFTPETMKEIYVLLNYCEIFEKVPAHIQEKILNEMNPEYEFHIREDIPLEQQNIGEDTISALAYLYVRYICEDEEERERLLKQFNENEMKYQEELRKIYNPDDLFSHNKKILGDHL